MFQLSVLICTYNRADILTECLQSLTTQTTDYQKFEVIVINNNSPDHTQITAESFIGKIPNLRVLIETQQGLSYARNRAYREAQSEWVLYLDDDALAPDNLVERAPMDHPTSSLQIFRRRGTALVSLSKAVLVSG